jgi:hypothetical protein
LVGNLLAATVILCVCDVPARATGTLWFNGNLDQRDALVNQTGTPDQLIYDNFIVPTGMTFTITSVFSNNAMFQFGAASTAHWEIRSGVSAGSGGTLLASGDGTDNVTSTGQTFTGIPGVTLNVYTNQVNGLNVTLGAGTYWLAVAPDVSNQNSFIVTTSGSGAIGTPPGNDGNSFASSTFLSENFLPTSDPSLEGPGTWDYSMGIIGTAAAVPEPSSVVLGLIGLIGSGAFARARRRARS